MWKLSSYPIIEIDDEYKDISGDVEIQFGTPITTKE